MEPKVSVIIPVYNVEPFLARCLDSVVGQTLRDIEIICVDDGSPDRSIDILNRYAAEDARIRVISQENRGLGGARNRGFDAATGEFVLYVDSDDWIDPAYCERLYEAARETGADVACASMLKIRPSYSKWTIRYTERQVVADVQEKFRVCRCPPDFYVMNKLLRREMLLRQLFREPPELSWEERAADYLEAEAGREGRGLFLPAFRADEEHAVSLDRHITHHRLVKREPPYGDFVPWYDQYGRRCPGDAGWFSPEEILADLLGLPSIAFWKKFRGF